MPNNVATKPVFMRSKSRVSEPSKLEAISEDDEGIEDQFNKKNKLHIVLTENYQIAHHKKHNSEGGLAYLT